MLNECNPDTCGVWQLIVAIAVFLATRWYYKAVDE